MYFRRSTQVPNKVFDIYLKALSAKELKVLLVVIRQTLGWVDENGNRKKRDWMSQKFFANRTGLSSKSVSQAIDMLVSKDLIKATTTNGEELASANKRKGKDRIYYELSETLVTFLPNTSVKSTQDPSTKGNNTKLTYTKQKVTSSKNHRSIHGQYESIGEIIQKRLDM